MPEQDSEPAKIQLASVEIEHRQYREQSGGHAWELIGYVNFHDAEIITDLFPIRVSVNRAILRLEFSNCDMKYSDAGYRRQQTLDRTTRVQSEKTKSGKIAGKARASAGYSILKGPKASAEIESEISGDAKIEKQENTNFVKEHHLVMFHRKEVGTGAMEWRIADPDNASLGGEVIGDKDEFGGRLGTVLSRTKGGWTIQPSIHFQPHAEIVDTQKLNRSARRKMKKESKANEKALGRKLGIVSALLGRELAHVELDALVVDEDGGST